MPQVDREVRNRSRLNRSKLDAVMQGPPRISVCWNRFRSTNTPAKQVRPLRLRSGDRRRSARCSVPQPWMPRFGSMGQAGSVRRAEG